MVGAVLLATSLFGATLSNNLTEVLVALITALATSLGAWFVWRANLRRQVGEPNGNGNLYQITEQILSRLEKMEERDNLLEQRDHLLDERQARIEAEHTDHRTRLQHIERAVSGSAIGDPYDWEKDAG